MKLYILSPHIDDAAFGLALTITRCAGYRIAVTIVNCFTVTKWTAVPVENKEIETVSAMRKKEDIAFYESISGNIKIVNLDLLDAPLRNGYIFQEQPFQQNELELVEELYGLLKLQVNGLLFCPLAIGHHIDHAICRAAVLKLYGEIPVLFYEDLPYARRIGYEQILQHIHQLEALIGVTLSNHTHGLIDCSIEKEAVIRLYRSQMNDEIALEIAEHLNELKGERIWGEPKYINDLRLAMGDNEE